MDFPKFKCTKNQLGPHELIFITRIINFKSFFSPIIYLFLHNHKVPSTNEHKELYDVPSYAPVLFPHRSFLWNPQRKPFVSLLPKYISRRFLPQSPPQLSRQYPFRLLPPLKTGNDDRPIPFWLSIDEKRLNRPTLPRRCLECRH
jgi:hypothetical protein